MRQGSLLCLIVFLAPVASRKFTLSHAVYLEYSVYLTVD